MESLASLLLIAIITAIVSTILYFVIKSAVKNAIIEAKEITEGTEND